MIQRGLTPAILVLALVACVEPSTPSPGADKAADKAVDNTPGKTPDSAATASTPGEILSLGDAKIMRDGHEDRAFVLGSDGVVTLAGAPFATLSRDGQMLGPTGELMMRVQADGSVTAHDGGPTGMIIDDAGGELTLPSLHVTIQFGPDGAIATEATGEHAVLLGAGSPQLVSSGCTGPLTRTCALVTLAYLSALGNPDSVRDEAAAPPP